MTLHRRHAVISAAIGRFLFAALAAAIWLVGLGNLAYSAEPFVVSVTAVLGKTGSDPALKFEMRNLGHAPLELHESYLPWGIQTSTKLYAFKLDAEQTQLEEALYVDDPGPNTIFLQPDAVLRGEISLAWRFPSLREAIKTRDVIVFWTYLSTNAEHVRGERFGGWVVVSKNAE